jgi:hypothetical protein
MPFHGMLDERGHQERLVLHESWKNRTHLVFDSADVRASSVMPVIT